ncbi:DHH family phosphoesterase [Aliikangiella coralliicola]|nr:DHH family phosphoesterase [Aliikangiella coralliicola]
MIIRKIHRREKNVVPVGLEKFPSKIQQIYASRGVNSLSDLEYGLGQLLPPSGLKNIQFATQEIFKAIERQDKILIVGDFDADGATSTAIMLRSLRAMGAKKVDFLVPDRFKFGYGLSVKLVEYAATLEPDLIITVDNGIANIEGVEKANLLNIPVIITDHHLAAERLPEALAIVNPNQPDCEFSSKHLAGVGVAFYLMLSLRAYMRTNGWFAKQNIDEPNLAELLDIVALGTVADVVVLDKNNRILVEQGLKRIRSGLACPGIKAILKVANRDETKCQASDLGFAIGPRINAAGRLDDMSVGIDCLLAESHEQALSIANRLDHFNRSRKNIEQEMLSQANLDINEFLKQNIVKDEIEKRPTAMCLFDPQWHQGVIGILASRVKDKINRPVIVFAKDSHSELDESELDSSGSKILKPDMPKTEIPKTEIPEQPVIKGSARSVKGVHIRDVLALLDSQHPSLIEKFGGHAMAAGLSIKEGDFQQFAALFHDAVEQHLAGELIKDEIITDSGLEGDELCLSFARELRVAGPWGQGFPEPLFDDEFVVVSSRIVGEDHLKLVVAKGSVEVDGIFFRCPQEYRAQSGDKVRLVYRLDINEFRGNQTVQLMIEQLEIIN